MALMSSARGLLLCCLLLLAYPLTFVLNANPSKLPERNQDVAPQSVNIELQPVLSGLASPVFVTNAHDASDRLFIVEQNGTIRVLQHAATSTTLFLDIASRVFFGGERGLLGLAFHPQFATNRRFFVYYTRQPEGAIVIAEYHTSVADPNIADTTETVIRTIPHPDFANHNGGMLAFGPDGFLYIGTGDGGSANDPPNNSQNIDALLGKILRIDIDNPNGSVPYSSPSSNPFFGPTPGADEVFAYGLRNPWRFSFDRGTGQLYVGDVGQDAREEVDTVTLGGNYGWRVMEGSVCNPNFNGGVCTPPAGHIPPISEYSHSSGRCSITGGYVYRGAQSSLPTGTYVFADYCTGEIFLRQDGLNTSTVLLDTSLNISSFGEDEAGEIYVVNLNGSVHRIVAASPSTPPVAKCKNVTVSAGPNCTANASIDDGSFDPDPGDTITLGQSPPGPYAIGSTLVTLTVTDNHSRSSQCEANVTVVDATGPKFAACPVEITVTAPASCPFATSSAVSYSRPAATDNCTANLSVVCNPPPGSIFPVGSTTVTCASTDGSNNTAQCVFEVRVYSFCLQDDSNPSVVVFVNAATGDYLFCSGGIRVASGRGAMTLHGCSFTVDRIKGDRTIHIAGDTGASGTGAGTAYVRKKNGVIKLQITDSQMSDNSCGC